MFKIISFIAILCAVAFLTLWFKDNPGTMAIDWLGYQINLPVGLAAIGVLIFVAVCAYGYSLWRAALRLPREIARNRRQAKRDRGYQALTMGMVAVAAGDGQEAAKRSKKAEVLLSEPPLTMLLAAQAAQLNGDEEAAEKYFTQMLDNKETEFLGLRGLVNQAMRSGDEQAALPLVQRAHKMRPKAQWVLDNLYQLEAKSGNIEGARQALKQSQSRKLIGKPEGRFRQALLLTELGRKSEEDQDNIAALSQVKEALSMSPDFLPAILMKARLLVATGKLRPAASYIEKIWATQPHPDLAPLYLEAKKVNDPMAQVKTAERLAGKNPSHTLSHVARAEASMAAELWGESRRHLLAAEGSEPTEKVYKLLGELEILESNNVEASRQWLNKATMVPHESVWICGSCNTIHGFWHAKCDHCGTLESVQWKANTLTAVPAALLESHQIEGTVEGTAEEA